MGNKLYQQQRIELYSEYMPNSFQLTNDLVLMGFFSAPASTKFHEAWSGGLFDHSLAVTETLLDLTNKLSLEWERKESPYIIGMYHDLCKCDEYKATPEGFKHSNDSFLPGHGEKSVMLLQNLGLTLTHEELLCIRYHMGAYNTADWDYFDRAIKAYPNVLYTHTADMIASKLVKADTVSMTLYHELVNK